jgi:hypothetical protein
MREKGEFMTERFVEDEKSEGGITVRDLTDTRAPASVVKIEEFRFIWV